MSEVQNEEVQKPEVPNQEARVAQAAPAANEAPVEKAEAPVEKEAQVEGAGEAEEKKDDLPPAVVTVTGR